MPDELSAPLQRPAASWPFLSGQISERLTIEGTAVKAEMPWGSVSTRLGGLVQFHSRNVVFAPKGFDRSFCINDCGIASMHPTRNSEEMVADAVDCVATACRGANNPVIIQFRAALIEIQSRELKRLYHRLPQLDAYSKEAIQQSANCIIEKVLRPPIESLRDKSGNRHGLPEALQRLFQLDD
jgi:hypothetical protein